MYIPDMSMYNTVYMYSEGLDTNLSVTNLYTVCFEKGDNGLLKNSYLAGSVNTRSSPMHSASSLGFLARSCRQQPRSEMLKPRPKHWGLRLILATDML